MNYYRYSFPSVVDTEKEAQIIAWLSTLGFDSFETDENTYALLAYVPENEHNEEEIKSTLAEKFEEAIVFSGPDFIQAQNWNAVWESNFEIVEVDNQILVKAPFHTLETSSYKYVIEINPKMAFGTGHHSTTWLMLKTMLQLNLEGKSVLDCGTGTGILAVQAVLQGADFVEAYDIDELSVDNAKEIFEMNHLSKPIKLWKGTIQHLSTSSPFDVVLANINRNVLLDEMPFYEKAMKSGGILLLSGFFEADVPLLTKAAMEVSLKFNSLLSRENWVCLYFEKP